MASRRDRISLHISRRRVDRKNEGNRNQGGSGGNIGIGFEVPCASDTVLWMREGLGVIVCMRAGKDDRDAEVKQRQRQAKQLLTHG